MQNEIHDLSAGYALDALDPTERAAYEAHLPTCERCRAELATFGDATTALALAATGQAPPAELRVRILDEAREAGARVVPLRPRSRRPVVAVGAIAAVAAAAAVGLGIWAVSTARELDDTRIALEQQNAAAAVLADPTARTVPLDAGNGRLVVDGEGNGVLVLEGLAPAPGERIYQVWVVEGDRPTSAGLFGASSRFTVVPVERPVPDGSVVAVTVEPAGGSPAPTTEPIVVSAAS